MNKKMNFEEALNELEDITSKLSAGEIPLEKSIELFERGMELKKICSEYLNNAEAKIKLLLKKDGEYIETEMDGVRDE